ncbi:MAG: hypothetical protein DRI83_12425, partial [Bacteroidetes bacterium]
MSTIYAQQQPDPVGGIIENFSPPERGTDADEVLHSQNMTGTYHNSISSFDIINLPAFDIYDCQAADDFRVPGGETWYISEINLVGNAPSSGVFTDVNVFFYNQPGTGLPTSLVWSATVPVTFDGGLETIDLGPLGGVMLTTGNYWISIQVEDDPSMGYWYWMAATPQTVRSEAIWQNPLDGFATGATTWTNISTALGGWLPTDLAFELVGYKGLPMAHTPVPGDTDIDIPVSTTSVSWELTPEVDEIQIYFGTEYPPVNLVQDWTTSLTLSLPVTLDWNLQYFWQINTRNAVVTTTGDIWGFTTAIQPPGSFTATAGDYDTGLVDNDVLLEWVSSVVPSRALLGYDIYENAVQIAALVPGDSYTVLNATYNMTGTGNTYYAIAVFDEGVSLPSNTDDALVNGFGEFNGYVDDLNSALPLELVTIDIVGVDPQGTTWTYQLFTDALGDYQETDIIAGTYDFTASLAQYYPETATGVVLPFAGTVTQDFTLTPWGPPACATIPVPDDEDQDVNPVDLELEWVLDAITVEYRLLFSEEFPPNETDDILVDWSAAAESYQFGPTDLQMNTQYFWKVQVRNMWGEVTACDTWGFTTTIRPPGAFTATQGDYDGDGEINDVLLEWATSENTRALVGYHLFENGIEIAMTTELSYTAYNRAYNMTAPGNEYWAVAEFDEGDSDESNNDFAYANG